MAYAIEVNGNRIHDEGEHEPGPDMVVKRAGGGELTFETKEEAEAHADALFARVTESWRLRSPRGANRAPPRSAYVVIPVGVDAPPAAAGPAASGAASYEPPTIQPVDPNDPRAVALREEVFKTAGR